MTNETKAVSYHARVMNIRDDATDEMFPGSSRFAYKTGHKDARHVAAEIASEADAELDRLREDRDAFKASSEIRGAEVERLRARVAELERDRVHAGVDICEVAAAVEVVRVMEIVKEVAGVVANLHEGPFRHGFEAACEEIEHRLRPCEHCDAALAKDGA